MSDIESKAADDKIACAMLRKLAETHEVPYKVAGTAADSMGIRVRDCDLGCF
jgi:putative aminopeptidase FrvX